MKFFVGYGKLSLQKAGEQMTVLQDLTTIRNEASLYGAGVQTQAHIIPGSNDIMVDLIAVPAGLRRKGIASHILDEYVTVADGWGVKLILEASTDFNTPRLALHQLYTKAGFVPQGNNHYVYYPAS